MRPDLLFVAEMIDAASRIAALTSGLADTRVDRSAEGLAALLSTSRRSMAASSGVPGRSG